MKVLHKFKRILVLNRDGKYVPRNVQSTCLPDVLQPGTGERKTIWPAIVWHKDKDKDQ